MGVVNSFTREIDTADRIVRMQRSLAMQQLGTMGVAPGPGQIGVQSLEYQLYVLTYGDSEFKLYKDLAKVPVFNLVHEYNVLQNYGSSVGGFVGMGALPPVNNSFFKRGWAMVKFAMDARMVPQQMLEIESAVGNYVGVETRNSIMSLMGKVENALFWGDSSLNEFTFDGVKTQVSRAFPSNVIDMRGKVLDPGTLENLALAVRQNWGDPELTKLYAPPAVLTPFTVNYIQNQRMIPGLWQGGSGNPFSYWDTQYGRILLRDDRFAERDITGNGGRPVTSMVNVPQGLPSAPTSAPTLGTPAADPASKFNTSLGTPGGYFAYCYAYGNAVGITVASPISSVVQVQDGQSVQLTIPVTGVMPAPTFIRVYRQTLSSPTATPSYDGMQMVTDIPVTVPSTTWTDQNLDLPGTFAAFLINVSKDGAHIGKLGDVRRFELAPVTMAYWFVSVWYGMLIMPGPQWSFVLKNIGAANTGTQPVNTFYPA